MKKSISFLLFLVFCMMILSGCNQEKDNSKTYSFTGTVSSVVEQNSEVDGLWSDYTVSFSGFFPTDKAFDTYNEQFSSDVKERHIEITSQTIFYADGKRVNSMPHVKKGDRVKFEVKVYKGYALDTVVFELLD